MKIIVNETYILASMGCLIGLADMGSEEVEAFDWYNPNSELDIRQLIRSEITPRVQLFNHESRVALQWSLRYYLTTRTLNWSGIFMGNYIPIAPPTKDPLLFFEILYEELFGSGEYHVNNLDDFIESQDISILNKVIDY